MLEQGQGVEESALGGLLGQGADFEGTKGTLQERAFVGLEVELGAREAVLDG